MSIFNAIATDEPTTNRIRQGTDEQEALWAELVNGDGHVVVEARAGCGKSSSSREAMYRMIERGWGNINYAVFNKSNADEFRPQCPPAVNVGTIHSFGNRALQQAFGSVIDKNKTYGILDEGRATKSAPRWLRSRICQVVSHAKNQNLQPEQHDLYAQLQRIILHFGIETFRREDDIIEGSMFALRQSARQTGAIDFDDMIWLPSIYSIEFGPCDVLFLDEVQDWNPAQHALIPLMCPHGRVVAVGDRYQSIYAWRGADARSMPNLEATLSARPRGCKTLPLTITFRCPKSHIRLANEYVADIRAADSNCEGEIEAGLEFDASMERWQPGDKVLCRTNAPLISAALQMIAQRRRALVKGRAVADSLLSVLRQAVGFTAPKTISATASAVRTWTQRQVATLCEQEGAEDVIEETLDRSAGLEAVLKSCESPSDIEPLIRSICSEAFEDSAVNFSTIHRAKGSEAERVWILESKEKENNDKQSEWEAEQERNCKYVAVTRSKRFLGFVEV